jgi:hypothetical protein
MQPFGFECYHIRNQPIVMKPFIYMLLLTVLMACNKARKKDQNFTVQIVVNSDYRKYLWDPSIDQQFGDSVYYDSLKHVKVTRFNSLKSGKIEVSMFSLLTDDITYNFDLTNDTTIVFDTTQYHNFTVLDDVTQFISLAMPTAEPIFIGEKVVGCFTSNVEKLKIYKDKEQRFVVEYSTPQKTPATFVDSLFDKHIEKLFAACKRFEAASKNGLVRLPLSTTTIDTYIRKGNFILPLAFLNDIEAYNDFKKSIGIVEK